MTLFLTASSFYSIFTQVSKTFNSTVALQVGFLKHLGDVATVLQWSDIFWEFYSTDIIIFIYDNLNFSDNSYESYSKGDADQNNNNNKKIIAR